MDKLEKLGSETAKNGFRNEYDIVDKFNKWKKDKDAQQWLEIMGYNLSEVEKVEAEKVKGSFKTDVQTRVKIYLKNLVDAQNISVKLVSNPRGYNQVDKRWVDTYKDLWNIPIKLVTILKRFCGEIPPKNPEKVKDSRRTFFNEMTQKDQEEVLRFFRENKTMIICDILKGRGQLAAEWMLVVRKIGSKIKKDVSWVLKPMNLVINYYSQGDVKITPRGSLHIGKITMQRKGGDSGRKTANMLQFKMNPAELFEL